MQETSLWAKNSTFCVPKTNELCIEWVNWDSLFCLPRQYCDIYKSLADHSVELREILDRLRTYRPDKCEFCLKEVNYLGHQITEGGVKPDPQKVAAITNFPTPASVKQLKTFCRTVSYYRNFIPNCSRIASPLHTLLKRDVKFEWKPEQEHMLQHLKAKLAIQPILQYTDFLKEFFLTMEASSAAVGAVLSQGPLASCFC